MEKTRQLQTEKISILIRKLAAPSILSLLVNSVNMAVDKIFVTRGVGKLALSGVTVSTGITILLLGFSMLVAAGSSASISLNLGEKRHEEAEKVIGNSIVLGTIVAILFSILGFLFLTPLLRLYGANEENLAFAYKYSTIIVLGAVFFILAQVSNNLLKGMGYAKRAFWNFFLGILVNLVLDPLFIFVFQWGVFGAALATVIGNTVCGLLAFQFLLSKKSSVKFKTKNLKLSRSISKQILSIGSPACIMQITLSGVSLVFNRICMKYGGTDAVSTYGMIYSIMMLVYMPIMGLGQGIQPILGYNYSGHYYDRVKETMKKSIQYVSIFSVICFLVIQVFSPMITRLFLGNTDFDFISSTASALRIFAVSLPIAGATMIIPNYFQYIGKYKESILLSMLRQILLLIPLVLFLPKTLGLTGIWIATPIADIIAFIVAVLLLKKEWALLTSKKTVS